jgi:hypothetical protein
MTNPTTNGASMSEIPAEHLPIIADRFRTFDDPRMSRDKLVELVHGYAHFLHMRTALEQMAEGARSNADFARWAAKLVANEREARRGLKVSRRLITVEMVL